MEFHNFYHKLEKDKLKLFWKKESYCLYDGDIARVKDFIDTADTTDNGGMKELKVSRVVGEVAIKHALLELKIPVQEFGEHGTKFRVEREGFPGDWKDFADICMSHKLEPTIAAVSLDENSIEIAVRSGKKIKFTKFEDDDIFTNLYALLSELNVLEVVFESAKLERPLSNMGMIVHYYKIKEKGSVALLKSYLRLESVDYEEFVREGSMTIANNVLESLDMHSVLALFGPYTNQGYRLLHKFIKSPLRSRTEIEKRQNYVLVFKDLNLEMLKGFPDLTRMSTMIESKRINLEKLLKLGQIICLVPKIIQSINSAGGGAELTGLADDFVVPLGNMHHNLQPLVLEIGRVIDINGNINAHLSPELHRLHEEKNEVLQKIESEHERVLNINRKIRLDKNNTFKVSRNDYKLVEEDFRKNKFLELSFIKSGVFFTTQNLHGLSAKMGALDEEIEKQEKSIKNELVEFATGFLSLIEGLNYIVAYLDVLSAFSRKINENWTKPFFTSQFKLTGAFHPLIRQNAIKNDICITDKRFVVVTGPNMGGKSTFLKMCGMIALLAQVGSFVPADYCETLLFDSIWVRIGANDCAAHNVSTFMVEMNDVSKICRRATANSLILVDELGRGTSALDGLSLALAIKEFLIEVGCVTLFATHFPQICGEDTLNKRAGMRENVLNYLIEDGACDLSFGILAAKMVGFPDEIIRCAEHYMKTKTAPAAVDAE